MGAFEKVVLASQNCLAAAWMQLGNAWVGGLDLGLVASSDDVYVGRHYDDPTNGLEHIPRRRRRMRGGTEDYFAV